MMESSGEFDAIRNETLRLMLMVAMRPEDKPGPRKPRTLYIASAFGRKDQASRLAGVLTEMGMGIVSSWHEIAGGDAAQKRANECELAVTKQREIAMQCLAEVATADGVIIIGDPRGRGSLVEAGYALGLGKPVWWVGDRSVTLFSSLEPGFSL